MRNFDAAQHIDANDPDGKSGFKGSIQTAMVILQTMMPEDSDHAILCDGDTCVGCALDTMRRLAGVDVGNYDSNGCEIEPAGE